MMRIPEYKAVTEGTVRAEALVTDTPLSFWGGVDVKTGRVTDVHHPLCGACVTGKVLCMPFDRGSCSGSGVMLEMIRCGTAPAGLLCIEAEPVLALAPLIGALLYNKGLPVRTVDRAFFERIPAECTVIFEEGSVAVKGRDDEENNAEEQTCTGGDRHE